MTDNPQFPHGGNQFGGYSPVEYPPVVQRRTWAVPVVVVLGVLLVAAMVAIGWLLLARADDDSTDSIPGAEAMAELCDWAPTFITYDYATIDDYFDDVLDRATGDFAREFSSTRDQLKQAIVGSQVRSRAEGKPICGVQSASGTEAKIVLSQMQSVTSLVSPIPATNSITLVATMTKVDGRWLVSKTDIPVAR